MCVTVCEHFHDRFLEAQRLGTYCCCFRMMTVIMEKRGNQGGIAVGNSFLRQNSWKKLLHLDTGFMALSQGMQMWKLKEDCLEDTR